jgi:hypothetical protein
MVCERLEMAPKTVKKGRFFAQKEHFSNPKISSFLPNEPGAVIYFQ